MNWQTCSLSLWWQSTQLLEKRGRKSCAVCLWKAGGLQFDQEKQQTWKQNEAPLKIPGKFFQYFCPEPFNRPHSSPLGSPEPQASWTHSAWSGPKSPPVSQVWCHGNTHSLLRLSIQKRLWLKCDNPLISALEPRSSDAPRTLGCVCRDVCARLSVRICIRIFIHDFVFCAVSSAVARRGILLVAIRYNQVSDTCAL